MACCAAAVGDEGLKRQRKLRTLRRAMQILIGHGKREGSDSLKLVQYISLVDNAQEVEVGLRRARL